MHYPKRYAVRPGEAGMLAILAKSFVLVYQQPRVAILSTGDELADLDERFSEEKIINSNSYGIAAAVQEAGGIPILLGIAVDQPEALKEKIAHGLNADILVLSGGVSMGDYDFTKAVFKELGADMNFWKLAIRPGQPLAFGRIHDTLAFGLPGNPVSSMVTFEQLVRPCILKMSGMEAVRTARRAGGDPREIYEAQRSTAFLARHPDTRAGCVESPDDRRTRVRDFNVDGQSELPDRCLRRN